MDRSDDSNTTDSCSINGNNLNGASFTLPPLMSPQTNLNKFGHPLFGENFGLGRRTDVHQMTILKDILDSAIRIVDEVCIDVNSNTTASQISVAESTTSAPTETCASLTEAKPPDDQDVSDIPEK